MTGKDVEIVEITVDRLHIHGQMEGFLSINQNTSSSTVSIAVWEFQWERSMESKDTKEIPRP